MKFAGVSILRGFRLLIPYFIIFGKIIVQGRAQTVDLLHSHTICYAGIYFTGIGDQLLIRAGIVIERAKSDESSEQEQKAQ